MPREPAQKAKLTITFEDGSIKEIPIDGAIALKLHEPQRQSLFFGQTKGGSWVMTYDLRIMDGKQMRSMELTKTPQ